MAGWIGRDSLCCGAGRLTADPILQVRNDEPCHSASERDFFDRRDVYQLHDARQPIDHLCRHHDWRRVGIFLGVSESWFDQGVNLPADIAPSAI